MTRTVFCLAGLALLGIPRSASAAPVRWRIEDGGNGHFYDVVVGDNRVSWEDSRAWAEAAGGYLATATSAGENQFIFDLSLNTPGAWLDAPGRRFGPWLGGFQTPRTPDPAANWNWVTGEPWDYTNWEDGEPNDFWGTPHNDETLLMYFSWNALGIGPRWNDFSPNALPPPTSSYAVEYVPEPSAVTILLSVLAIAVAGRSRILRLARRDGRPD